MLEAVRFGNCSGDFRCDLMVERVWDDMVWVGVGNALGESVDGGDFHSFGNSRCPGIEGSAEDPGEGKDIVDLIREVTSSGADDCGSARLGIAGEDFGVGVSEGKDDGIGSHGSNVIGGEESGD